MTENAESTEKKPRKPRAKSNFMLLEATDTAGQWREVTRTSTVKGARKVAEESKISGIYAIVNIREERAGAVETVWTSKAV